MLKKGIKAIFFDLDGTLRLTNPSPTDAFIYLAQSFNVTIDPATARRVKIWAHQYWGQNELVKQDMDRFDTDTFWINYSKLLLETVEATQDLPKRANLIREWFGNEYQPEVTLAQGSRETLSHLKAMGYILGLISNRSTPLQEAVQELELEGMFDLMLAAGEIGCWKPHPGIFEYALTKFPDLRANECIYVGDNYFADGLGAEGAGLVPIIFDPEDLYEKSSFQRIRTMTEIMALFEVNVQLNE